MKRNFVGVVALDVTKNDKIDPKTGVDYIKSDEFNRENMGKSAG